MKKTLLSIAVCAAAMGTTQAQSYFSEDFTTAPTTWTNLSLDADTLAWGVDTLNGVTDPLAYSFSWNGSAYTPDNLLITDAIDLTSVSGSVELTFDVRSGSDTSYFSEHYAVYVTTSLTPTDITSATPVIEETLDMSHAQGLVGKTADISSFAGQTVYLAFRHYNCTDQWFIGIDNISVHGPQGGGNGVEEFELLSGLALYPNPANNELNLRIESAKSGFATINIMNMVGSVVRTVENQTLGTGNNNFSIAIDDLPSGSYFVNVMMDGVVKTSKLQVIK